MATTFDVISLGTFADIDPTEGNNLPENGAGMVGQTAGSAGAPLWDNIQTFALGTDADGDGLYDMDNTASNDSFTIDGGPGQVFDSVANYDVTLNYSNGTTGTAEVIVVQDTAGNLYLMPQKTDNADQAAMEAHPIESITFDTYTGSYWAGIHTDFEPATFAVPVCLATGTGVQTPDGEIPVECLRPGDLVTTVDRGPRKLLWVCRRRIDFTDPANHRAGLDRPICFQPGSLGNGRPARDLVVSPQHRILATLPASQNGPGGEVLVPAKGFLGQPRVRQMQGKRHVEYFGLVFARHELIYAGGAPIESFRPGPVAMRGLSARDRQAVASIYPGVLMLPDLAPGPPVRPICSVGRYRRAAAAPQYERA